MELWDVYDASRTKTGETMVRGENVPQGKYHLVIHVCIFNAKGEMLIQQRQPFKQGWGNYWDVTVAGSVIAGETSQMAAQRELAEEIGMHWDFSQTLPTLSLSYSRGFDDIFLVQTEVDLESLCLQAEEVQAVQWANKETILKMTQEKKFIPYLPSVIEVLFALPGHSGGRQVFV